jgi:L-ascorbate metabolism protein UlaG (beta-lactamase superfamily)
MRRRTLGKLVSAGAVLTLGGVGYAAARRSRNPYYSGPVSDHFDGVRFFVPGQSTDRGPLDLVRWQLGGGRVEWPESFPSPFADKPPARVEDLRVALVGHATLLIQVAGINILTDPIYAERASPIALAGPKRANPPGIAFDDLPAIDLVLVTHNHYDHLDTETLTRLWHRDRPRIVAPLGNDGIIRGDDASIRVEVLDWRETADAVGEGFSITLMPAYHWSARWLNDRRMALWGAFAIQTPRGLIYAVGDSGYADGAFFREVRTRFGAPRVALLPIGAYEPRWFMQPQHMNPEDAVRAFQDLGAETALGHHWGTFQLTNEAIERPVEDLAAARAAAGIARERFPALRPGEVWEG